ncbi:hypothetical protein, partial [Prevotella nigrescens]|uniref:hypothetical protein n=1 Tax=Prevotella nigrescens TaxID=28133 RepID=UPI00242C1E60
ISQFTPTSTFLPFQGLVALPNNHFYEVKQPLSECNTIDFATILKTSRLQKVLPSFYKKIIFTKL